MLVAMAIVVRFLLTRKGTLWENVYLDFFLMSKRPERARRTAIDTVEQLHCAEEKKLFSPTAANAG